MGIFTRHTEPGLCWNNCNIFITTKQDRDDDSSQSSTASSAFPVEEAKPKLFPIPTSCNTEMHFDFSFFFCLVRFLTTVFGFLQQTSTVLSVGIATREMWTSNTRLHSLLEFVQPEWIQQWYQRRRQLCPGHSGRAERKCRTGWDRE